MRIRGRPSIQLLAAGALGTVLAARLLCLPWTAGTSATYLAQAKAVTEVKQAMKDLFARTGVFPKVVDNNTPGLRPVAARFSLERAGPACATSARSPYVRTYSGRIDGRWVDEIAFFPPDRTARGEAPETGAREGPAR